MTLAQPKAIDPAAPAGRPDRAVAWQISDRPVAYVSALRFMEERAAAIAATTAQECVWLLEHPPLYTAGTSATSDDLLQPGQFPVHQTGRGGQYTYHGPGQRVAYAMLDLNARGRDVRAFVYQLEEWLIATLDAFNVRGERRAGRVGVWVWRPDIGREDKIAAIGVRVRRWVTFHGVSLNVEPDLSHFSGIVPCGVDPDAYGVTSLVDLGLPVTMTDVDLALRQAFEKVFGATVDEVPDTNGAAATD
ncbi:MAG: lipoyl(octanoyl) transferase LipB [Pseudomonadota bacterium]